MSKVFIELLLVWHKAKSIEYLVRIKLNNYDLPN